MEGAVNFLRKGLAENLVIPVSGATEVVHNDRFDNLVDFSSYHLGNYRLVRSLGHGGFASVYLGEHLYLQRLAAIKVLHRALAEKELARFLEEARLLAKLSHPHIVRVLEFAVAQRWKTIQNREVKERIPFLVMDYAPGGNLRNRYPAGTRLALDIVIAQIKQVAAALQYAHERNIIHRDIKPENLLMNERQEVMLSDFGLALFTPTPDLLSLQGMAGTLAYTAPEQLRGKPSFASDQYSLAIIAYEWLAGSRPFGGGDVELIMHQISSSPPPLRSKTPLIGQAVEDVIFNALAKDPKQRYPTVQAFADALEQASRVQALRPVTRQFRAVKIAPSPEKPDFPAFHYFTQKAVTASPEQNGSLSVPVQDLDNKGITIISSSGQRNRLRMLQKVRAFWVHGVLKQSLHGASFIPLGLDERQDAVASPWSSTLLQSDQHSQSLAPGTTISEIYDQAGGELLILGEAGSGKTTLLLELARHLLDRAERDEVAPMPVVFLLSSWAEKQQSLEEWLIEELSSKYQVPRALGELWVRNEMLLPLLDGLDEVVSNARSACVEAINSYKKEHGLSSLVVCSRLTEYLLFPPRVLLRSAVVVQPLTMPQIESYLHSAGNHFDVIYQVLCEDPVLQRLVTTPLMLNIITLVSQDLSPEDFLKSYPPEERYQRILKTYVEQMLRRYQATTSAPSQQLIHGLTYLAIQMQQHNQTVFYLEQMQPDWIENIKWRQFYRWFAVMLPGAIIGAFTGILSNVLLFHAGSIGSIYIDAVYGMVMGYMFSGRRADHLLSERQTVLPGSPKKPLFKGEHLKTVLFVGLVTFLCLGHDKGWMAGLVNGLVLGILSFPLSIFFQRSSKAKPGTGIAQKSRGKPFPLGHIKNGTLAGLACGLTSVLTILVTQNMSTVSLPFLLALDIRDSLRNALLGLLLSMLLVKNDGMIHRAEIISWSWQMFWQSIKGLKNVFYDALIGTVIGVIFASKQLFQGNLDNVLSAGVSTGLLVVIGMRLVYALLRGVSSRNLDNRHRFRPNEGIKRSLNHGLLGGVLGIFMATFFSIITSVIASVLSYGLSSLDNRSELLASLGIGLSNALLLGPSGGLLAWLLFGGLAFLQYNILRFVLWRTGSVPLNLLHLLEDATTCILLHKVGGGYLFTHRLLREYFASLHHKLTHHKEHMAGTEPLVRLLEKEEEDIHNCDF